MVGHASRRSPCRQPALRAAVNPGGGASRTRAGNHSDFGLAVRDLTWEEEGIEGGNEGCAAISRVHVESNSRPVKVYRDQPWTEDENPALDGK